MKKILTTLTSLTALALFSNSIVNIIDTNTTINNCLLKQVTSNSTTTSLFNNQYGYLNDNVWITNQSVTDHKFYSYDTSHANYLLSDGKTLARTLFAVNDQGQLYYKKQKGVIISAKDKFELENTKQEMIRHQTVNIIKNDYNAYSSSSYSATIFSGSDTKWQYLQFGGVNKHIDISSQLGADKVAHSNNLSETSGLYYLAQAARQKQVTQLIADNLGQYFISHSSLQKQFAAALTTKIIDLISNNNDVYNFILNLPFTNDDPNHVISYIFDSNNNIVAVATNSYHYHQSNTGNFVTHVSPGPFASIDYTGDIYINYQDLYYLINNQNDWTILYKYFTNGNLFNYQNMENEIGNNWSFQNFWNGIFKADLAMLLSNVGVQGIIIHIDCYGTDIWHPSAVSTFHIQSTSPWN